MKSSGKCPCRICPAINMAMLSSEDGGKTWPPMSHTATRSRIAITTKVGIIHRVGRMVSAGKMCVFRVRS